VSRAPLQSWKWITAIFGIALLLLSISIFWLIKTESGLRWAVDRAPEFISVQSIEGNLGSFTWRDLVIDLGVTKLSIARGKVGLRLRQLFNGTAHFNILNASGVKLTLASDTANSDDAYVPWQGLDLPINVILDQLQITNLEVVQDNRASLVIAKGQLQASMINNQLTVAKLSLDSHDNSFNLAGVADLNAKPDGVVDFKHDLRWRVSEQFVETSGAISGNWQQLQLTQFTETPVKHELNVQIHNILSEKITWDAALTTAEVTAAELAGQKAFGQAISLGRGNIDLSGDFSPGLGIDGLNVAIDAKLSADTKRASDWKLSTRAALNNGKLSIESLELNEVGATTPGYLSARGNIEHLLSFIDSETAGIGVINLQGEWTDLAWPLGIAQTQPDEFKVLSDGDFVLNGTSNQYRLATKANGSINDRAMSAQLSAEVSHDSIIIRELNLKSGASAMSVNGSFGMSGDSTIKLDWSFKSPNLGDFLAAAGGSLNASGSISGPRSAPTVLLKANAQAFSMGSLSSQQFNLTLALPLGDVNSAINMSASAKGIRRADLGVTDQAQFGNLSAYLDGTIGDHTLSINGGLANMSTLLIRADGGLIDRQWQGQITSMELDDDRLDSWSLDEPMQIEVSSDSMVVSKSCLRSLQQSICLDFKKVANSLSSSGVMQALDLANINKFLGGADFTLSGIADGNFSYVSRASDVPPKASLKLNSSTANINWIEEDPAGNEQQSLAFESISISLEQLEQLRADIDVRLENGDFFNTGIDIEGSIDSDQFSSYAISGQSTLQLADLGILPAALSSDLELNGSLKMDASIGGSIENPELSVSANVMGASTRIPVLDLLLNQISIQANSTSRSRIDITGNAMSGDGQLTLLGNLDLSNVSSPQLTLAANGKNLQLANTSELTANGNLDLKAKVSPILLDLQGQVSINNAKLNFGLPENAVLASTDVIVLGSEEQAAPARQRLDITIDLGSSTHIQAQGLDANLAGMLRVYQEPESIIRGQGQIDIRNGSYKAYGQELKIDKGTFIFSGGSIDDPNLDLHALKTVGSVNAGVRVSGRASTPQLALYSTPSMPDQDILSVLIFDKRLGELASKDGLTLLRIANSLRGDGQSDIARITDQLQNSLGLTDLEFDLSADAPKVRMGKQLASKLYVGYGYGLLDATQSLILKYKLNDAWSIKADLGADSGADLKYEIER